MALAFNSATKKWERTTTAPLPSSTPKAPVTARPTTGQTATSLIGRQIPKNTGNNVNESQAMFGAGLTNQTLSTSMPTQNSGVPKPTVATTQNPVVDMSKPTPVAGNVLDNAPAFDFGSLSDGQLQDMIARGTVNKGTLSQQDQFKMYRSQQELNNRQLQASQNIGKDGGPMAQDIANEEAKRVAREAELAKQTASLVDKRRAELDAQYLRQKAEQEKLGRDTMSAAQGVLSFSGFGRSTYAAEKQADIQDGVNSMINQLDATRNAEIARYEAERQGADALALASMDENINAMKQQNYTLISNMTTQMNAFNQQNAKSQQEKLDNILALAVSLPAGDLTEEEQAQAQNYGSLLLDKDGNIDNEFAKTVPPKLLGTALQLAAQAKGAIVKKPETVTLGDELYQLGEDGEWKKVAGNKKEPEWKSDGIGGYWRINPITGAPEEWNGQGNAPQQGPSSQGQQPGGQPSTISDFISKYEGFRETPYWDVNGWAIGYGQHAINGVPVKQGDRIDRATADADLANRVNNAKFKNLITVPLSESQQTALYSLEHNVGSGVRGFPSGKGIIDAINKGDLQKASNLLANSGIGTTNAATKEVMPGLVNRRKAEAQLLTIPQEFETRNPEQVQTGGQYSQSQKNLLEGMKDKSLGATELKLLKQQGLSATDVYDYNASQKQQASEAQDINNIILPDKAPETTRKSYSFGQKMQDAHKKLLDLKLEKDFTDRTVVGQWFQENVPNAGKSTKQKDLELLKQAFITGVLRQESGAAITDSEFDRYDTQFFPKQGDTAKTIEKKQQLREQAIRNMYQMAGNDANGTPIVQIYDKTKQGTQIKPYNASTKYKSGDTFTKDGKTYAVGVDGNAYEQ